MEAGARPERRPIPNTLSHVIHKVYIHSATILAYKLILIKFKRQAYTHTMVATMVCTILRVQY